MIFEFHTQHTIGHRENTILVLSSQFKERPIVEMRAFFISPFICLSRQSRVLKLRRIAFPRSVLAPKARKAARIASEGHGRTLSHQLAFFTHCFANLLSQTISGGVTITCHAFFTAFFMRDPANKRPISLFRYCEFVGHHLLCTPNLCLGV